jgi:hypothetical protein
MSTTNRITPDDRPPLPNGQVDKHVNGHGKESAPDAVSPRGSGARRPRHPVPRTRAQAASDDTQGAPHAPAAVPAAASPDPYAHAEVACVSSEGSTLESATNCPNQSGSAGDPVRAALQLAPKEDRNKHKDREPVPPGTEPLPDDTIAFTEALHMRADFLVIGQRLLNSGDEKIVKGVWEHMLELRYGQQAAPSNTPEHIVIDMPRPKHDDDPPEP